MLQLAQYSLYDFLLFFSVLIGYFGLSRCSSHVSFNFSLSQDMSFRLFRTLTLSSISFPYSQVSLIYRLKYMYNPERKTCKMYATNMA